MIIELYGLSGAGKSTFARHLARDGTFSILRVRGKLKITLYATQYFIMHPIQSVQLAIFVVRYADSFFLLYFKIIHILFLNSAHWSQASGKDTNVIIDQGFHQAVISLFEHQVDSSVLTKLHSLFPKPDLLVVFDIPNHTREKRLLIRSHGSVRDRISDKKRREWQGAAELNHQTFLNLIKNETFVRFVRNDEDMKLLQKVCLKLSI